MGITHSTNSTNDEIADIGIRLRQARRAAGITQADLGLQAGTNQAVIQKIENGLSHRPRCILEVAEVLNVNPAWLQFGDRWAKKDRE